MGLKASLVMLEALQRLRPLPTLTVHIDGTMRRIKYGTTGPEVRLESSRDIEVYDDMEHLLHYNKVSDWMNNVWVNGCSVRNVILPSIPHRDQVCRLFAYWSFVSATDFL